MPAACIPLRIPVPWAFVLTLPRDRDPTAKEAASRFAMPRGSTVSRYRTATKKRGKHVRRRDKMFLAEGVHLWPELLEETRPSQNPREIRARCKIFQFTGTFPASLKEREKKHRSAQAGERGRPRALPRAQLRAPPPAGARSAVGSRTGSSTGSSTGSEPRLRRGAAARAPLPLPVRGCSSAVSRAGARPDPSASAAPWP